MTPPVSIQQFLGLSPENAQNSGPAFVAVGAKVVMAAGSQQSAAVLSLQAGLIWVDYVSDVDCFLAWGSNPTAVVDTTRTGHDSLSAGESITFRNGTCNCRR